MRKIRTMLIVMQLLLLLSATVWAGESVSSEERFSFLGERKGFYYYGGETNIVYQGDNQHLWLKLIPGDLGRERLTQQGDFQAALFNENQKMDSILCRVAITEKDGVKVAQVEEQTYYDQSANVMAHWVRSEAINQGEKPVVQFIANECTSFLDAYFNFYVSIFGRNESDADLANGESRQNTTQSLREGARD